MAIEEYAAMPWLAEQQRETMALRREAEAIWTDEGLELSARECVAVGNAAEARVLARLALNKAMLLQGDQANEEQIARCYHVSNTLIRHFGLYQNPA